MKKSTKNGEDQPIPSIYLFCDRWCERCTSTRFCKEFAGDPELNLQCREMDASNKKFRDFLLEKLAEYLPEAEEKLKALIIHPPGKKACESYPTVYRHDELVPALMDYGKKVNEWFEQNFDKIHEIIAEQSEIRNENLDFIDDSIEVIQWYQYFLGIKFQRATTNYQASAASDRYDRDGSAKITLVALDRCIAAWLILVNNLPGMEDQFLYFLFILNRIKRDIEHYYPGSIDFKRPGLED
jgi:hypothetical protein